MVEGAQSPASRKVAELLRSIGIEPPAGLVFQRTRAGRNQRNAGAWIWFALAPREPGEPACREVCGSFYRLSELKPGQVELEWDRTTRSLELRPKAPNAAGVPGIRPMRATAERCWWLNG